MYIKRFRQSPAFLEGFKAMAEPALALIAWSTVTNIALLSAGLSASHTLWFNMLVYAGSAQLAVIPLIVGDYPLWTIWLTALIVNSRFVIFSAALQPYFKKYSLIQKLGIGYVNGDIVFVKFLEKFPTPMHSNETQAQLLYFLGLALGNWLAWQFGVLLAIAFETQIPSSWGLGFAGTLALVALVIPTIKNKTALVSALTATLTCVLTINLPYRLTIVCSVIAGVLAAAWMDRTFQKRVR
jgi:predicted branched-subunit amino acid permease